MPSKDRITKISDDLLRAFEEDTPSAAITEEGAITRVAFRSRGWLIALSLSAVFLLNLLYQVTAGVFILRYQPFGAAVARLWPEALVGGFLLVLAAVMFATKNELQISQTEVIVERGIFSFPRATKIPIAVIRSVRTGSFYADVIGLVGQDRYVELQTGQRTYRLAWGLSAEQCEAVAEAIRKRTKRLPNST